MSVGDKMYQVERYLAVQCLDESFVTDEEGNFRPTIKPHYAIAPINGAGTIYEAKCKTLIKTESGFLETISLPVNVHDNLVSPPTMIEALKEQLLQGQENRQSCFYTSYVLDEKNAKILVTQHALLNVQAHDQLCRELDAMETPTVETLAGLETAIAQELQDFLQPLSNDFSVARAKLFPEAVSLPSNNSSQPSQLKEGTPRVDSKLDNTDENTEFLGMSAAWWLTCLQNAAIVVGLVTLVLCAAGAGMAAVIAPPVVIGACAGGAAIGAGLAAMGLFSQKQVVEPGGESPECTVSCS